MSSALRIRPYITTDHAACLRIFRSNMPKFFIASEELDFIGWLDSLDGNNPGENDDGEVHYFVAEVDDDVRGCGGWGIRVGANNATLIWGMVDSACQGQGIGGALTQHRLDGFRAAHPAMDIAIDTSHHAAPFYKRFGFVTEKFTEDGYEPGLHRYDMRLRADL